MKKVIRWILCHVFNDHKWTSKAEQGIPPKRDESGKIEKFSEYAKMYCKHCKKESSLNARFNPNL